MKCKLCGKTIEQTFLKKLKGTYVGKHAVCRECQTSNSMDELKKKLG